MKKYPDIYPVSYPQHGTGGDTGSWRFYRPVIDREKCAKCLLCWVYCPDAVIDRDSLEIKYQYCKGCGICAEECPAKAISMVREDSK
ncbi:MAG: 4Fe-4S binding protein [Bacillota bacterium]|jgi:pyruvate ferredoxin oxidoreductase delta subunit